MISVEMYQDKLLRLFIFNFDTFIDKLYIILG